MNKSRVVVLKHMFTLQELEEDASLLLDLKEDVRDECSSVGEVTNVVLHDACVFSNYLLFTMLIQSHAYRRSPRAS